MANLNNYVVWIINVWITMYLIIGKDETFVDKLRSILAQLEFSMLIKEWASMGVPFHEHLYVPEVHPITGTIFCEMEDEGHVFKVRIGISTAVSHCNTYFCAYSELVRV